MSVFKRPFLDVLAELRRGKAKNDLTDLMHQLVTAVRDTGQKGELVLKIVVEPKKNDESRSLLEVTDSIALKLPKRAVPSSLFFVDDDNNLLRDDPSQQPFTGMEAVKDPTDKTGS